MNFDLSSTQIAIALAAGVVVSCYGFLTLFILGTLLGAGSAIGLAVVWTYDQYA